MKKFKETWQKNKILIVLLSILIICLIAIIVVCLTFFLGGNKSVYGDRLKDIENYPITDTFKNEYIDSLENEKIIDNVTFEIKGRIIYITIHYVGDTSLVEAESKASSSLETFSEKLLGYYDIQMTLICDETENSDGFVIMGARNASGSGSGVVWNNNTKVESEK